jgi:hypothetical protein
LRSWPGLSLRNFQGFIVQGPQAWLDVAHLLERHGFPFFRAAPGSSGSRHRELFFTVDGP